MAPSKRSGGKRSPHARYAAAGTDGIGRLELTRPEKLNATDDDSVGDLDRAATLAGRDRKARVVVVAGRGRCPWGSWTPRRSISRRGSPPTSALRASRPSA